MAVEFAKKVNVVGFDISKTRIDTRKSVHFSTREVSDCELNLEFNVDFFAGYCPGRENLGDEINRVNNKKFISESPREVVGAIDKLNGDVIAIAAHKPKVSMVSRRMRLLRVFYAIYMLGGVQLQRHYQLPGS